MSKEPSALRRTIGLLRPHLPGQRRLLAGGGVILLLEVVFRVLEPWPVKIAVDALTRSLGADLSQAGPEASVRLLIGLALLTVAVIGLRALCNYGSTVLFAIGGSRMATALRARVFDHVQALGRGYHLGSRSGDVVQRLVTDVGKLQEVAVTAGLPLAVNVVTLVAMLGVITWLDPVMALVVLVTVVTFLLLSRSSSGRITTAARRTRRSEGDLATVAQETLGAITVVHAYNLEQERAARFGGSNQRSLREGVQAKRLAAALERRTDVLVGIATAAVLLIGGLRVRDGALTPGDLVLFLTYLKTTMKPLRDLAKYTGRIARAAASGERVAELLDQRPEINSPQHPEPLGAVRGELELRGVTVRFDDGPAVLDGMDLQVPPGQSVALVGESGAGKSTVTSLLLRFIDPQQGSVHLDGTDLRQLDLATVRAQVALVLQEPVLFSGTVAENIANGRPGADLEQIRGAAALAEADEFILRLPEGYDSVLGERGATLSGGQRQRIALARAFLKDAPVLVLDEPTTGLDAANAAVVRQTIQRLAHGRTTLVVTHDQLTATACDRVVWVADGRVRQDCAAGEVALPPGVLEVPA